MIEEKYYQPYFIVLTNGKEIETWEDVDVDFEEGLLSRYAKANNDAIFEVQMGVMGNCAYIPKKNILYIYEGFVRKAGFDGYIEPENDNPCT